MYDRILVPTDGSAIARDAVAHAIEIGSYRNAEIHALFVADTAAINISLGPEQVDRIRQGKFSEMTELREEAETATSFVVDNAQEAGLSTEVHHAGGMPHRVIAKFAKKHDIDLIVMGSHGRSGVKRALLGSVTERTLRTTNVPVLVVGYHDDD